MPCRCGMVKLMRLDVREQRPIPPKSVRVQKKDQTLLRQRIQRITMKKPDPT